MVETTKSPDLIRALFNALKGWGTDPQSFKALNDKTNFDRIVKKSDIWGFGSDILAFQSDIMGIRSDKALFWSDIWFKEERKVAF
jgi:hypothetical protein